MNRIESLLGPIEEWLKFLADKGYTQTEKRVISPESSRGGFVLVYSKGESQIYIEYLDGQIEIQLDSDELFGPTNHAGFGGNMFDAVKLQAFFPKIAEALKAHA